MTNISSFENKIYEIRAQKVMLDSDLSYFYGIEVKRINEAVKRNLERFPEDFMFQLQKDEWDLLRSQIATFKTDKRKFLPYAFTEQGVAMLSSVLRSQKAIDVNIAIVRSFIKLRQYMVEKKSNTDETRLLKEMLLLHIENTENNFEEQGNKINQIVEVLNNLIKTPPKTRKIGFCIDKKE